MVNRNIHESQVYTQIPHPKLVIMPKPDGTYCLRVRTRCGYLVPKETECNGSHRVDGKVCEKCSIYRK